MNGEKVGMCVATSPLQGRPALSFSFSVAGAVASLEALIEMVGGRAGRTTPTPGVFLSQHK